MAVYGYHFWVFTGEFIRIFFFIFPIWFRTAVYGYNFWIVFTGEFIPMVKNTIKCKKCACTQALI